MRLLHSGDCGDVIYSLPCVRAIAREHGPVDLLLKPCTAGEPWGGRHFGEERVRWLLPLIQAQEYVASVKVWDGEEPDLDLNLFRRMPIDFRCGEISGWYRWAFPVSFDLAEPWLKVEAERHGRIIVNRTMRYNGPVNYRFMAGQRVGFVGLPVEFEAFQVVVPDAKYIPVNDALELAGLIAGSRFFVGNQSVAYSVAEALKVPRLLEVCPACPNVIVHGPNGYDAVNQLGFEDHFSRLASTFP